MRRGFTVLELLVLLAVVAIIAAIVALDVRPLNHEARNAATELVAAVRLTRARAMGTTSAHRLVVDAPSRLRMESAIACSDPEADWTEEERLSTDFRAGTELSNQDPGDVLVCFDPRGIGTASPSLELVDARGRSVTVDVYAGGAVTMQ